jgi:hypothetical protein
MFRFFRPGQVNPKREPGRGLVPAASRPGNDVEEQENNRQHQEKVNPGADIHRKSQNPEHDEDNRKEPK